MMDERRYIIVHYSINAMYGSLDLAMTLWMRFLHLRRLEITLRDIGVDYAGFLVLDHTIFQMEDKHERHLRSQ